MLEEIVEPLVDWYRQGHRELPWRQQKNPYYIWVSEIMLQQTRVEAVKPYFQRFIQALPTVQELAACPEEQLLKLWEGLGYYNRVRNMQKAAELVCSQMGGQLPADYEKLRSLPGIGNYTAGAVASIAFDIPVPAVDGNVLRVLSRVREDEGDIMKQSVRKRVEAELGRAMPKDCPGDLNQALMELGAMVCVPKGEPKCGECPLAFLCRAKADGRIEDFPVKSKGKSRRVEPRTVLVIRDGERVAIRRRPARGLLAGLYEFPNYKGHLSRQEVLELLEKERLTPLRILPLQESKHIFSHVEWQMTGYLVKVASLDSGEGDGLLFVDIRTAEEKYPVPAAFGAYARELQLRLGQEKYNDENQEEHR